MDGAFENRRTLQRIAATLLALAFLAERAAGRSFPVRFLVLAILRRAEAVAQAFVAGEIGADCPDMPCLAGPSPIRGSPADAETLALRLRMLSALLTLLSGADNRSAGPAPDPILLLLFPAFRPALPHDTS